MQLDQLRFAEGSPVGGPEEHQQCPILAFQGIKRLFAVELIAKLELWRFASYGRPNEVGCFANRACVILRKSRADKKKSGQIKTKIPIWFHG